MDRPGPDYCHSISAETLARLREWANEKDGLGISIPAINVARYLAVVPTVSGGIQIEWHCNGWDVEIEVDAKGEFMGVFAERVNA